MPPNKDSANQIKEDDKASLLGGPPKNMMVPVLLLILKGWNAHGYELIQKLMQFGFHSIDQGNVYRVLRQLEKDNMVKSFWDTNSGGPAKRVYSLTDAGQEYLESWAGVLENYQKMLDQFFNMYTQFFIGLPSPKKEVRDTDTVDEEDEHQE